MRRHARLLVVSFKASLAAAVQYRVDFVIDGLISLWWMGWTLVPLLVAYSGRGTIAGWSLSEALIVVGWFALLRGLVEAAVNPSLQATIEGIRSGALDYLLLKPADAQFLVSTARFQPWKLVDVFAALALVVVAFHRLGRTPAPLDVAVAIALLAAAMLVIYSIWIIVVSAAFYVVRLDNLSYLFHSVFDAARWPVQVFRGAWRVLFTFVIPLGLMTTYPAMAILGKLEARSALFAGAASLAFAVTARAVFQRAISRYTSASS